MLRLVLPKWKLFITWLCFSVLRSRFLFWSDWGSKAKIEQARLDGSNRSVIINSSLGYPNGIVIDTKSDILYWCDAQLDKIEAYYLIDGKRIVVADKRQVAHPFGLSLFKNYIYWTDWGKRAIRRLNVQTNQTRDMRKNMLSLMGISVYDESRQKGMLWSTVLKPCSNLFFE